MTTFSKTEKYITLTILFLGTIARLMSMGWTFLFYFWLFIPCYATLFFGQLFTILNGNVVKFQKFLVYASSAILIVLTIFQVECFDNDCKHLIDALFSILDIKFFPSSKYGLTQSMTWTMISLHVIMGILGLILMLYRPRQKNALNKQFGKMRA